MKIFITGNLGFIGTHLAELLIERGFTIIGFDKEKASGNEKYECILGNILDVELLNKSTKDNIDLIIHLAADHKDNLHPKSIYYDVNVQGTQNLIDACTINNINRILFTSTVAVYGLNPTETSEDSAPDPLNDYARSKLQAEQNLIHWWKKKNNRSLSIIRPTVVFGENNRGNVFNLMKQLANNRFIMVGSGENKKSIAYVGNLIEFILKALEFEKGIHIYNYADKPDYTMNELVESISNRLKLKSSILHIPYILGLFISILFDFKSYLTQRTYLISKIRIQKFCSNSIISTVKLDKIDFNRTFTISQALDKTIQSEFRRFSS